MAWYAFRSSNHNVTVMWTFNFLWLKWNTFGRKSNSYKILELLYKKSQMIGFNIFLLELTVVHAGFFKQHCKPKKTKISKTQCHICQTKATVKCAQVDRFPLKLIAFGDLPCSKGWTFFDDSFSGGVLDTSTKAWRKIGSFHECFMTQKWWRKLPNLNERVSYILGQPLRREFQIALKTVHRKSSPKNQRIYRLWQLSRRRI